MIDDRLAMSVEHADGRVTRWGPDEVDGKNIPNDLTFGTSIPGGYGPGSSSLLRRLDQDHPDQDLFDTVTVYGPGGRIAHQGRMQQFPRSHGDSYAITPGWVGWSAHLRDNPSFREIYVDRDLSRWTEAPLARRIALAAGSIPMGKIQAGFVEGGLQWSPPNEAIPDEEVCELHYDCGPGLQCNFFGYQGMRTGAFTGFEGPLVLNGFGSILSGALALDDAPHEGSLTASRTLALRLYLSSGPSTPAAGHLQRYSKVAVWGDHQALAHPIANDLSGVYASEVIADVVDRAAPMLSYSAPGQAGGSIEPTTFVIPHLVYRDPVTPEFVISDANKHHLWDWGVYDNREFFYRQPDPDRLCWEARLGDGAHMDADGLTGEQVINGVFVTYTDPTGVPKSVGPPGGSFDVTHAALEDTSDSNPANSHGIPAKWDQLALSFPTTEAGAIQIGAVYLAERSLAIRRGSLTLTGTVQHPTEGKVPVWRVRAGDWVRVTDLNGENATVQRKIIETSYSHASRSISLSLDNTVAKLTSILERVGVMTGIQTGSGF